MHPDTYPRHPPPYVTAPATPRFSRTHVGHSFLNKILGKILWFVEGGHSFFFIIIPEKNSGKNFLIYGRWSFIFIGILFKKKIGEKIFGLLGVFLKKNEQPRLVAHYILICGVVFWFIFW